MQRLLSDSLIATAEKHPQKVAIVVEGTGYTYFQLLTSSKCLAATLMEKGIKRGERVAIFTNNTWECSVCIYAVQLCGAVFVIINAQTKSDKLQYFLKDSGATALLTEAALARIFLPSLAKLPKLNENDDLKVIVCYGDLKQKSAHDIVPFSEVMARKDSDLPANPAISIDLAALIYTSGSTGTPKGVMQTHQSMLFTIDSVIEYLRLSEKDNILCFLPMAFSYGLYQLLMSVSLGATLILERSFLYPAPIFKRTLEQHVSVFPGVPTIFAMLLAAHKQRPLAFPHVKTVTSASAALPIHYIDKLAEIFPNAQIYNMYGQTECKRACYLAPGYLNTKPSSVGKAIPGTEMFLRSEKGNIVAAGETGILYVRGPHVMLGYWNKPDLSRKALTLGRFEGDRLLCTHDLFYQDADGFFYFVGRCDDIIKTGGEKVSPAEVEKVLYSIPEVKDAAVVGVKDDLLGQAVCVFITADTASGLDERTVKRICMQKLENYMIPKHVIIWESLPKNVNAKTDKTALKAWATENVGIEPSPHRSQKNQGNRA